MFYFFSTQQSKALLRNKIKLVKNNIEKIQFELTSIAYKKR